jgi:predicted nuclease of predicted toxin-antitoxin system
LILWIDAQLSPSLALWIRATFGLEAYAVRDLGLRDAKDVEIFLAAREAKATVLTKDSDFVDLQQRLGPPPVILWLTCGNTSNRKVREILRASLAQALELFGRGEAIIEISDAR